MSYREALPLREVTNAQLGMQILESFNLASIISNAINFDEDMKRSASLQKETATYISNNVLKIAQRISGLSTKTARDILKEALTELPQMLPFAQERLRNQAIQSSAGYRLTGTMYGQQNSIWSQFNLLDFHAKALFDIPLTFAERQIRRFYNAQFGLERFGERDAFNLYNLGKIKADYILDSYQLDQGLDIVNAKALMDIKQWQFGKPDIRTAWRWWRKGLVDESYYLNIATKGYGYTKKEANIIADDLDYDPTLGDVMGLGAIIPLDSTWIEKVFNKIGMSETDKTVFKSALEKKTIKDEIRSIWGSLLNFYQYGMYTDQEITDLLTSWYYQKKEIDIKIQTCQLYRAKLVSQLMRDAEIYLYRKDVINEDELYVRLIAMDISEDVANALTRNEASKKGIEWEAGE